MTIEKNGLEIGFIGAGKVARALGCALCKRGYSVSAVSSRSYESALTMASLIPGCKAYHTPDETARVSSLVFITTPDSSIATVSASVNWQTGQMVVHTSGADSRSVLKTANNMGALTGVFHPLATIVSNANAPDPFMNITITIEAEPPLRETLEGLAHDLEADTLLLQEENRALYHASAVFVSNYVMALADIAAKLWQEMGFDRTRSEKALMPLLKGAVNNLQTVGLPGCLTGPVSRGDTGTIKKHLTSLEKLEPPLALTYRMLGSYTVDIAKRKGSISPEQAKEMTSILNNKESSYD
ncbi:MAG: DUF2520 domain-containing protein [Dehalococcoidales bacterium]|jgi:predicted short-subunit dehydrogenase-like oxidoreductase (DUF2520 family)|nr:DUF2520 domain-containing protein [Dehalococcoidales bacterium]MDD5604870.1 DUF2520 domain-containing protein [Dehalococcoidales bacterium]MDX9986560.1 DUF2520 domain-containing protein [Dehalococcoidales bacterium]